jgi:SAM-dependent methyltransferase
VSKRAGEGRYPIRNDSPEESERLSLLERASDPGTISLLESLGTGPGWDCAELGAGRGSIAAWLSDLVGAGGSVTAIDRDVSQLSWLAERPNVTVLEADLTTLVFADDSFDLIHSRAILMHLEDPFALLARLVPALRPAGVIALQEADGAPVEREVDAPAPYRRVMVPLARRWTAARRLAAELAALGLEDVRDEVVPGPLVGGTPRAEFWKQTIAAVGRLRGDVDGRWAADAAELNRLLDDPGFSAPHVEHHTITARRASPADR